MKGGFSPSGLVHWREGEPLTSLSFKLDSFQRELNDRLGGLLVAREDAR
jgi:hypothetical protein